MATGIVRSVKSDGTYEADYQCHTLCKFDDPDFASTRDTSILSLFSFGGTLSARNYEVLARTAPTTVFNILAAVAIADTTIQFGVEAFDYLEAGQQMVIGNEVVTIVSVDATGLATVVRGANAAAYTTDDTGMIIGKPTNFCEGAENCYVDEGDYKIFNSIYRSNYCVKTCKEELCELLDAHAQCDRPQVMADKVNELIRFQANQKVKELNRMALWGVHTEWNSTTVGSTRGLRNFIVGVQTDSGSTISGIKYDVADAGDNSCALAAGGTDINGANGVRLLQEYFDKVDLKEGKHNVILMNTKVKHALRDAIYQCTDSCAVGTKSDPVNFASLDRIDAGPLGTLIVVEDNSIPMNEIYFAHTDNLKWFGHCSVNGRLQDLKTVIDEEGFMEKYETTVKVAFDASQNMCSDLGMIYGFTISTAC